MDNKQRPYFPNLDGLRFFAFLIVLISHLAIFVWPNASQYIHGELGVSFFFVLSGFLITYLLFYEQETKGFISLKDFYARRALRIFPVYFLTLIIGIAIAYFALSGVPFSTEFNSASLPWFVLFLANFYVIGHEGTSAMLVVLWSISVEQQFYLVWPYVASKLKRNNIVWFLIVIILSANIFRFVFVENYKMLAYSTFSVMSDLAVGALMGYASFVMPMLRNKFGTWWTKSKVFVLYTIFACAVYLTIYAHDIVPDSLWTLYAGFMPFVFSIIFAFIIFEQNYSSGSLWKVGKSKVLTYLGKISYGLYAYHLIALAFTGAILSKLSVSSPIVTTVVMFGLTVLLAHLSYKYVEKRILRLKGRFQ